MEFILLIVIILTVLLFLYKNSKHTNIDKYLRNIFSDSDIIRHDERKSNNHINADNVKLNQRINALEEENLKLLNRIAQIEKTLSHSSFTLQVLSQKYNELETQLSAIFNNKEFSRQVGANEKENRGKTPVNNIKNRIGTVLYVTSPSAINPIRFATDSLSLQSLGYFYYIRIVETEKAEFGINNDRDAVQAFLSSLAYQQDCVEVLAKQEGSLTHIETICVGELKLSGKYWILTKKIQIKIK